MTNTRRIGAARHGCAPRWKNNRWHRAWLRLALGLWTLALVPAARPETSPTPAHFKQNIRPLFARYCLGCHSTEKKKGDLDLERFTTLDQAKREPKVWQNVAEQIANDEMPPKDKPQPSPAELERLSSWIRAVLGDIARARAGDPGPVVLRRLSNAEYSYTLRDLTGVESLEPAREFPVDGAAGEGFMNTGNSLVMSPALFTKYLEAAKDIARHAVLLPDTIRFSPSTTRRDWTEEILEKIREFYRGFTDPRGGDQVNLQGIVFETNEGGRLPLEKYLEATLELRRRRGLRTDRSYSSLDAAFQALAAERSLSPKYLARLWKTLAGPEPSLLIDGFRARWREAAPTDAAVLAADIAQWQKALWKFSRVGHIGKAGGPKAWLEPVSPLAAKQEVRFKIPPTPDDGEVTLYLVASDAGDGNADDFVIWQQPRFVAPGRPTLLLRDVRDVSRKLIERRDRIFATVTKALAAAAEAAEAPGNHEVADLAQKHGVDDDVLDAWLDYLGIGSGEPLKIDGYFTNTLARVSGYSFIQGWGSPDTPSLVANSSDQPVRIPGNMKAHSVAVHPSPKLQVAAGWRSPQALALRVDAKVTHAHPECGNGVSWALELRRGAIRRRLAAGVAQGSRETVIGPLANLEVQPGDLVSLRVGPRNGNHACDLTAIELVLTETGDSGREWNLAKDISSDVLAGNPHADRFGNQGVWHFYTEPDVDGADPGPAIPEGSLLARWHSAESTEEKRNLAEALQRLLASSPAAAKDSPDATLYRHLASFGGPLLGSMLRNIALERESIPAPERSGPAGSPVTSQWALDPARFGRHPNGRAISAEDLCVQAPSRVELRLPADLVAGYEFVATGVLDDQTGAEGSVQLQALTAKPVLDSGLFPSPVTVTDANGPWTSDNRKLFHATPILVNEGSAARKRIEAAFDEFRQIFPAALCYTKIVPVDEVVTLTLFYREDHHLGRLMLDPEQQAALDRLWDELHYVSHDALTLVDAFEQLWQYATQDADPKVFEPLRQPIADRAAAFRQRLDDTQPAHVETVLEFAGRAYRRPLTADEKDELRALYRKLRGQELDHDEAIRLTLARVLVAPAFLYRLEKPGPGTKPGPVSTWELASRLSYFLWSSMPDAELRAAAASGQLRNPAVLAAQAERMLRDSRVRRLATEFACQWLHVHAFDEFDEKSERHFPSFAALRGPMYEEAIQFFTDLFQGNRSVLNILDADYTFVNAALAEHYGIPGVAGAEWERVAGVKRFSRGGVLALGATLARQSGASRTSPILRGNWVSETLLGEKLPRPPKEVPRLPDDETGTDGLTVRQLTEKHTTDPKCYGCHKRIDPYGYALEGFDAIGARREKDLGTRPVDTRTTTMDGAQFEGIDGLRDYLLTTRREAFLRQFCRKLLGYALGRAVLLSDEPLLSEMMARLKAKDYRIGTAAQTIVRSRQFREIRGRDAADED